jgi:uncharacterized membrane protein YgcG
MPGGLVVAMLATALLVASRDARAAESITSFYALYTVMPDGSVEVVEEILYDFGTDRRRGIFRDLVTKQACAEPGPDSPRPLVPCPPGSDRLWRYTVTSVESRPAADRTYGPVPWQTATEGDGIRIRIGDPDVTITGAWSYRIRYTIEGALTAYETHDELYWNATGRWTVTILESAIEVRGFPMDGADAACFQGERSADPCRVVATAEGDGFRYEATRWLGPGEELTIVAGWEPGVITVPPPFLKDRPSIDDYFELDAIEVGGAAAGTLAAFGVVGALWWRNGRDRRYRGMFYLEGDRGVETRPLFAGKDIVVEYLPPDGLRPAQMGLILDERADPLDATATIVDLAVRGYLHIEELDTGTKIFGRRVFGKPDWKLTRTAAADGELLPYERTLFDGLFKTGDEVQLSDLKNQFHTSLKKAQDQLYDDAVKRHWFAHKPPTVVGWWIAGAIGLIAAGAGLGVLAGWLLGRGLIGLPIILAGLALLVLAPSMPRRTAAGSEALRRVLGFRLYIATAETDRQRFNAEQGIFARYLPYAIVFGCVDRWAKAFEGFEQQAAADTSAWYTGIGAFHVASFSSSLRGLSGSISSTIASTPSSGGSGFSGGSSGGGGGGGGGGSW